MRWLAENWHLILLVVVVTVLIYGAHLCAEHADRLERAAKAAGRSPITVREVVEHGARTVDALEAYSNQEWAAGEAARANAALLDKWAVEYPMRQRPRLVDQADSEINPLSSGDES